MRIIVTAGPTREYIDPVRFITNGSSGQMGYAVALAAADSGHEVMLLTGPVSCPIPSGVAAVPFLTVDDLRSALETHFHWCDALVMAAAVGDFTPAEKSGRKLSRSAGEITLRLIPTGDILAGLKSRKKSGQVIVAFAVEDGPSDQMEQKARDEMARKGGDMVVLNTPAAMGASDSDACILLPGGVAVPWARRDKTQLAKLIVRQIEQQGGK